jgi:AraC-like DNA-binding protein
VGIRRYVSAEMKFELAFAVPAAPLAGIVGEYSGWIDRSTTPVCLRELPCGTIPVIVYFDGRAGGPGGHDAFTAGLHDKASLATSTGPASGVQANLTARGARLLFNRPLADLANRTVSLRDLFGASIGRLQQALYDARTWEARFAVLDRELLSRIQIAAPIPRELSSAWELLVRSGGRCSVRELSHTIGWSERHLGRQFDHQFGMTPKTFARVLRFGRAVRRITSRAPSALADIALDCGYFDQAHFTHDFHAFAGVTPTELLASRRPAESGFSVAI